MLNRLNLLWDAANQFDDKIRIGELLGGRAGALLGQLADALMEGDARSVATHACRRPTRKLPDPDDRRILGAAVKGRADVLVSDNLKDFPARALPADLVVQAADEFLLYALDLQPAVATAAAGS